LSAILQLLENNGLVVAKEHIKSWMDRTGAVELVLHWMAVIDDHATEFIKQLWSEDFIQRHRSPSGRKRFRDDGDAAAATFSTTHEGSRPAKTARQKGKAKSRGPSRMSHYRARNRIHWTSQLGSFASRMDCACLTSQETASVEMIAALSIDLFRMSTSGWT